MIVWKRRAVVGVTVVAVVVVALVAYVWWSFDSSQSASNIADFHPVSFQTKADTDFFYSIGDDLGYSNQVNPIAPNLLHGHIQAFLVSPDAEKIAAVANGSLYIINGKSGDVRQVGHADSIYHEPKPIGEQFIRDDKLQWSRDSQLLYLIRDQFYNSKGSQLFSDKGELWKYELRTGSSQLILKPFPASDYFLGDGANLYFGVATGTGDLALKGFDGKKTYDNDVLEPSAINPAILTPKLKSPPFYSFSILDYRNSVLLSKGVTVKQYPNEHIQDLAIAGRTDLRFTEGETIKGPIYCSELLRSVFLPGDRYFLLNADYCGNYNGQLLIDTQSGNYERLPANTVVYVTANTDTYMHYRVTVGGIDIE